MNKVSAKWIGLVGLTAMAVAFTFVGCAGSKTDNTDGSGGSGATGGDVSGEGGSAASDGGSTATNGGTSAATTPVATGDYALDADGAYVCRKGVPAGPGIAPGDSGTWGKSSAVAGGTFTYQKTDAEKPTLDTTTTAGVVVVTATVAVGAYTGFGLYFKDPEKCWDVSSYKGGIRVTIGGDLGGGELLFQVQTNTNYPKDIANNKGGCLDPDEWSGECANNTTDKLTIPATPAAIDIPWTSITGGKPVATVDPTQILGIQWQVNCTGDAACAVNLTIGEITFY